MATVFLNGRFISQDEARISAFDAGLQHAVGLFETMSARLVDGRAQIFRLQQHLERLTHSARILGLSDQLRLHALAEAVSMAVERAALPAARVRLTITGGDLNLLNRRPAEPASQQQPPRTIDPTIMIVVQPATQYPAEMFERGINVVIADMRLNPLDPMSGHKTLNYWGRLRELQAAAAKRAAEAVLFLITNHIAGGCVSNIFLFRDGALCTPIARGEEEEVAAGEPATEGTVHASGHAPDGSSAFSHPPGQSALRAAGAVLPSPVLPGITRGWVRDWAAEHHVPFIRRMLTIDDLLSADEVFLTNSSWGILPVVRVEKEEIGSAIVGGLTADIRRAWLMETGAEA
jgi:branched-chain amino acid aminotransferase